MTIDSPLRLSRGTAALAVLLLAPTAYAQEAVVEAEVEGQSPALASGLQLSLKIEPGLAAALSTPQSRLTELGMGHSVKLLFGLNRYLAIGPSFTYTRLPATLDMDDAGSSWTLGGGGRLMRPHDAPGYGISPWVDADVMYVRTGELDRPGFAAGAGISMPLGELRKFWIGPFARYSQIIQGQRDGFDNRDAKILTFGIGLEVTSGLQRKRTRLAVVEPEPVADPIAPPPSDRDGDTVIDSADNCPDVAGLVENAGCPAVAVVVAVPAKIEVTEKISFEWNSAKLEPSSHRGLDEVVRQMKANPGIKVEIGGHASSDGEETHNQGLSEQRAASVSAYLISHGVAAGRLHVKGFSSSVPVETNTTVAGRESNRRVEFTVDVIIVTEGNTP